MQRELLLVSQADGNVQNMLQIQRNKEYDESRRRSYGINMPEENIMMDIYATGGLLRSLTLDHASITNETIYIIAKICPKLILLSITGSSISSISDVSNGPLTFLSLCRLQLMDMKHLSSILLNAPSLLYFEINHPSHANLSEMRVHAPRLKKWPNFNGSALSYPLYPDIISCISSHSAEQISSLHMAGGDIFFYPNQEAIPELKHRYLLCQAAATGNLPLVDYLIKQGVDIELTDPSGNTPFLLAVKYGHEDVVFFLLQVGANSRAQNRKKETAISMAIYCNYFSILEKLWLVRPDLRYLPSLSSASYPIHLLCQKGLDRMVYLLLSLGVDIAVQDAKGRTPLHILAYFNHVHTANVLVESAGIEYINCTDNYGLTPLHLACKKNHLDMVRHLTQWGASLESPDAEGRTPVDFAERQGHHAILAYLEDFENE